MRFGGAAMNSTWIQVLKCSNQIEENWESCANGFLKRKLGDFFLSAQSFYRPQTKTSYKIQFSPKSPKVGQKSGQRVQNSQNKNHVSADLLGESINSFIRATGGIHQFFHPTYCGNPFQHVFQSGGCLSIMSTISGLLLLDLLLFKSHVVSICLRVQLWNFGH